MNSKGEQISNDLNLFIYNHPDSIVIVDIKGIILAINKKSTQFFKKNIDELIGTSIYENIETKAGKKISKITEGVIKTKESKELIYQEKEIWWKFTVQSILNKEKTVEKIVYYIKDVTEEIKTKQNLLKKEIEFQDIGKKYKIITEHMTDFVFQITLTGKFTYVNPVSIRYGYKPDEMIGKNFTKFVPKKELPRYFNQIKKMISGKKIDCFESFVIHKNGNLISTEFSGQMVKIGKKRFINGIMRNINERKILENERDKINKRNKLLLENSNCPITYLDLEGNIILINKIGSKNLKGKPEDLIGKSIYDKLPEFADEQKIRINKILKTGKGLTHEDLIDLHGSKKWFLSDLQPVKNENDKIIGIQIFSLDITYLKELERNLRKSEEKYRNLFHNSNDSIFIHDLNGKLFDVNNKALNLFGYSRKEILLKNIKDLHPSYALQKSESIFKEISKKGYIKFEIDFIKKNGEIFSAEVSSSLYKTDNKNVIQGIVRDITERKKTEYLIKKSEEKYRSIFESTLEGIVIADINGKILEVNSAALDILGYESKELIGATASPGYVYPKQRELMLQKLMKKGFVKNQELVFKHKDGSPVFTLGSAMLLKDKNGKIDRVFGIFSDITERVKAEQEIKKTKDYLQNVIDSTSEIIFTIDKDFKIKTWNKTAEQITGYRKNEVVGKSIDEIDLFDYPSEILEYIKYIKNKKTSALNEISIKSKFGIKKIFSLSPSYISDESDNIMEVLFVCTDVTHEKRVHDNLKDGYIYLVEDSSIDASLDIFKDMMKMKHEGLFIGREKKGKIKEFFKKNPPDIIRLTTANNEEYPNITTPEELYQRIKIFLQKNNQTVILIDRIDYLITNNSFELVMKILYKINDLIEKNKSILLLNVNMSYLNNNQIAILRQEVTEIPKIQISDIIIDKELFDIIEHVYNKNKINIHVNYGEISNKFSLSKITTKKRIEILIDKGLIISKKHGKSKILFLTNKGNKIIEKKTTF